MAIATAGTRLEYAIVDLVHVPPGPSRLAQLVATFQFDDPIVIALPRGGVPVAWGLVPSAVGSDASTARSARG
jgi:hypothetical protein